MKFEMAFAPGQPPSILDPYPDCYYRRECELPIQIPLPPDPVLNYLSSAALGTAVVCCIGSGIVHAFKVSYGEETTGQALDLVFKDALIGAACGAVTMFSHNALIQIGANHLARGSLPALVALTTVEIVRDGVGLARNQVTSVSS
ncbi:MAG: hypothetical protein HC889_02225 [Synechococcaceae cyanobacterium SM1_2_3]|nr:hypothetical protein [Synechococcaceae cyanobacterium SM1_2_3]